MHALSLLLLAWIGTAQEPAAEVDPLPPPVVIEPLREWTFHGQTEGWAAEHHCTISAGEGRLKIVASGDDPYLHVPLDLPGGRMVVQMKARTRTEASGAIYWATDRAGRSESQASHFPLRPDGQWHEYTVPFTVSGRLLDLRLNPGEEAGEFEIEWIRLGCGHPHPLVIRQVEAGPHVVRFSVKNEGSAPCRFEAAGKTWSLEAGATVVLQQPIPGVRPLEAITLEIDPVSSGASKPFPAIRRTVFVYNAEASADWILVPNLPKGGQGQAAAGAAPGLAVRVARDGSVARLERGGRLVAVLGPLVTVEGELPGLKPVAGGPGVRFAGDGLTVALALAGDELSVSIEGRRPCEGPVVRPLGPMQQALLAGLEYLSHGERSSSTLDIETAEHLRFAPDPLKLTLPLMAVVTDRASVAVAWDDMTLQPVFATPNFFDGTDDHRMALRGKRIAATIRVAGGPLEECILWAVRRRGLPPLPPAPRSAEAQRDLCLAALGGPLRNEAGWGHCLEPNWPRQPYADMASTLWRLSGQAPNLPRLVPGGAHIPNASIYFVTSRAKEWLAQQTAEIEGYLGRQQPDGSFRYEGKYLRGHFENTSSGACARPAAMLLDYARLTGDARALAAGVRTLEYMKRFCVPRGAQVWELSLHTPDQLASAYLVWAYVRGYELTRKQEYLAEARRWAASGLPFVYLWTRYPVMLYATPPVYGATNWQAPNWMGLPVQWVGLVYAYALTMLAPYDHTLDWNQVARGILIAGEQMQYPDGSDRGLLPDSFTLEGQRRNGPRINPCALVSLRLVLDGQLDSLAVACDGPHHVVAPLPVTIRQGQAHVRGQVGLKYQVLLDGRRIVDVASRGEDVVPLP